MIILMQFVMNSTCSPHRTGYQGQQENHLVNRNHHAIFPSIGRSAQRMREPEKSITYHEAVALQKKMKEQLVLTSFGRFPRTIGGCDVSVTRKEDIAVGSIVVMDFNSAEILEEVTSAVEVTFPYIPGLLAFREGPVISSAFQKLQRKPELLLCDGHGICHPRGFGIASYMGVMLGIPTIGCAKSHLCGDFIMPGENRGDYSWILDEAGDKMGMALRTRSAVAPVYISPGHLTDFQDCLTIILSMAARFRLPDPLRIAHHSCKTTRTALIKNVPAPKEGKSGILANNPCGG